MKFRIVAALLLSSFLLGTAQANAITAVPKATRVVVSTTSTTAKVSWPAFAKSKVTAIKVTAAAGASKSTKTLAKSATSHVFYNLKSFTLYTFSVTAYFGSKAGAAVTYKLRTKAKPSQASYTTQSSLARRKIWSSAIKTKNYGLFLMVGRQPSPPRLQPSASSLMASCFAH